MSQSELESLVSMANDIARNLSFQDDADAGIADHLTRFWAPSMRAILIEHLGDPDLGLHPAAAAACARLRDHAD